MAATTINRPTLECRNPACFAWAQPANKTNGTCDDCGWELATVTDTDTALRMPNGQYALVDCADLLATGDELRMKAWATRLRVRANGHALDHYELPCVCWHGKATAKHTFEDLNSEGRCRYCEGTGTITLAAARAWNAKQ